MAKKDLSIDDIVNWWLGRFFSTDIEKVMAKHGWSSDDHSHASEFLSEYAVSQEQMDEFNEYFYKEVPKMLGLTQKYWKRTSWAAYLNSAPMVKDFK